MLARSPSAGSVATILIAVTLVAMLGALPAAARSSNRAPFPIGPTGDRGSLQRSQANVLPTGPRPIAWLNDSSYTYSPGNLTSIAFTLTFTRLTFGNDEEYFDLGENTYHASTGVTNFTNASDPDFNRVATAATDGLNEGISLCFSPSGGGSGCIGSDEAYWFGDHPDLVGHRVDYIHLNITALSIVTSGGTTSFAWTYSWEFWGEPLFVFFVPPTDADGYTLLGRTATNVSVGLSGPGNASLEWNGVNVSMNPSGPNWTASMGILANGVYTYRVWATNATGAVFATPVRTLTVDVGSFIFEGVDQGYEISVAVSRSGALSVCYYSSQGLVYAEHGPSGWSHTTLGAAAGPCSLAFDAHGNPHISYVTSLYGTYAIEYATRSASVWNSSTIATGYYSPTSIAINPVTELPVISYTQVPSQGLKLATLSGGVWTTQVVNGTDQGSFTSLAFDPLGHPWIAYEDWPHNNLSIARYDGFSWTFLPVAPSVTAASLAFDPGGVAHIAYANATGLQYATWNGRAWSTETVDPLRYYSATLIFDASGRAVIGYSMGAPDGDVRVAEKNGTWSIRVVNHGMGDVGNENLVALPSGAVGVAFQRNISAANLVFATNAKDTLPPTTTSEVLGALGANGWYTSTVQVILTAQDDLSGVQNTTFSIDAGPWTVYTAPVAISAEGRHTFEYQSVDYAGNAEPIHTLAVDIDFTPPSVSASVSPSPAPSGWILTPATVILSASDTGSGVSSIAYRMDAGGWVNYTSPFVVSDGVHLVQYRSTDFAGFTAIGPDLILNVDTRPPVTTAAVSGTAGDRGWYISPAVVNLTAADDTSGVASLLVQMDGGTWTAYVGPFSLDDGSHMVRFYAKDVAGNSETVRSLLVNVDTTRPVLSGPSGGHFTTSRVVLTWLAADGTSGVADYAVSVDAGAFEDLGGNTSAALLLSDGIHGITIRATDYAGNSVTRTVTVTVDTNLFSFTGPYSGIPTVATVVAVAAVAAYFLLRRRRKQPPMPAESPRDGPKPS